LIDRPTLKTLKRFFLLIPILAIYLFSTPKTPIPPILITLYLLFDVLAIIWLIKPWFIETIPAKWLKNRSYFKASNVVNFISQTALNILLLFTIEVKSDSSLLIWSFLAVKIATATLIELICLIPFLDEYYIFPPFV
jgi:hypothetical protein